MTPLKKRISVLLPSRGRTTSLLASVSSILDLATEPDQIEVLLAMDSDDADSQLWAQQHVLSRYPQCRIVEFYPMGFALLNVYLNTLAALAQGHWLFFWNDDSVMKTPGWDLIVDQYREHPMPLLRFHLENFDHPFPLFPVITKEWFLVLGAFSYYSHVDRFAYNLVQNLGQGFLVNIPVTVFHDRADLTGNNNDATFQTSSHSYNENRPEDPFSDDYPAMFRILMHNINKMRVHLSRKLNRSIPLLDTEQPLQHIQQQQARSHAQIPAPAAQPPASASES